jgi:lipopolysaccharide export LptBFGC system permease protein LptF
MAAVKTKTSGGEKVRASIVYPDSGTLPTPNQQAVTVAEERVAESGRALKQLEHNNHLSKITTYFAFFLIIAVLLAALAVWIFSPSASDKENATKAIFLILGAALGYGLRVAGGSDRA